MYVLAVLGYALICQVKEKNVVLKMLLQRRAKYQQEIKNGLVEGLYLFSILKEKLLYEPIFRFVSLSNITAPREAFFKLPFNAPWSTSTIPNFCAIYLVNVFQLTLLFLNLNFSLLFKTWCQVFFKNIRLRSMFS